MNSKVRRPKKAAETVIGAAATIIAACITACVSIMCKEGNRADSMSNGNSATGSEVSGVTMFDSNITASNGDVIAHDKNVVRQGNHVERYSVSTGEGDIVGRDKIVVGTGDYVTGDKLDFKITVYPPPDVIESEADYEKSINEAVRKGVESALKCKTDLHRPDGLAYQIPASVTNALARMDEASANGDFFTAANCAYTAFRHLDPLVRPGIRNGWCEMTTNAAQVVSRVYEIRGDQKFANRKFKEAVYAYYVAAGVWGVNAPMRLLAKESAAWQRWSNYSIGYMTVNMGRALDAHKDDDTYLFRLNDEVAKLGYIQLYFPDAGETDVGKRIDWANLNPKKKAIALQPEEIRGGDVWSRRWIGGDKYEEYNYSEAFRGGLAIRRDHKAAKKDKASSEEVADLPVELSPIVPFQEEPHSDVVGFKIYKEPQGVLGVGMGNYSNGRKLSLKCIKPEGDGAGTTLQFYTGARWIKVEYAQANDGILHWCESQSGKLADEMTIPVGSTVKYVLGNDTVGIMVHGLVTDLSRDINAVEM